VKSKERIIFIHIPRTAGGTFSVLLDKAYSDCQRLSVPPHLKGKPIPIQHLVITGHFAFRPRYTQDFLATFLRNPINRIVSYWLYHNQSQGASLSLYEFIESGIAEPQADWLKGSTLNDFDFIGITERFEDSLRLWNVLAPKSKNDTDIDTSPSLRKNASDRTNIPIPPIDKSMLKKYEYDFFLYQHAERKFQSIYSKYHFG